MREGIVEKGVVTVLEGSSKQEQEDEGKKGKVSLFEEQDHLPLFSYI